MRRLLSAIAPCLILPIFCFVVLSYQSLNREIKARLPLLTTYYLSNQLTTEIVTAQQREPREFPPNYRKIIQDYRSVTNNEQIAYLKRISDQVSKKSLAETLIARFVLWRKSLPLDFLDRDPVGEIENQLRSIQKQERLNSIEREKIVITHSLVCLRQRPGPQELVPTKRGLPDEIFEKGLVFCGEKIPLERADVRKRIEYQIAYLLADFRDTTSVWIRRKDRYGEAIRTILKRERVPPEFTVLPALESGFSRKVVSPSMAGGWWQFVRPTAIRSLSRERDLDWSLRVDSWKDERRDLALSTRSAARYLKWLRSRLSGRNQEPGSWLTAAAAYNAGLTEVKFRTAAYATGSYWDIKLPAETEEYVPRWIAFYTIEQNRQFYGMEVPNIAPILFDTLEGVQLKKDLQLNHLAVMAECSVSFLREINSAVEKGESTFRAARNNMPVTHTIHLPAGCREQVLSALKSKMYLKE